MGSRRRVVLFYSFCPKPLAEKAVVFDICLRSMTQCCFFLRLGVQMANKHPPTNLHADTIDGVISSLNKIIDWSIANNKRTGYFASLYRKVTVNVKQGIAQGAFDDGVRMERLDIIFANRYLDAFEAYYGNQPCTKSWRLAFDMTERWFPLVLQHLMLSMNAHINLDLGVAAAQTVPANELTALKADFDRINELLSRMIDEIQNELGKICPMMGLLDNAAGRLDEKLASAGMGFARKQAWQYALDYTASSNKEKTIRDMDLRLYLLGEALMGAGFLELTLFLFIRLLERGSVAKKITALA